MAVRFALMAVCALALGGCDAAQSAADDLARDQAKTVVNGVVEDRFPGVDASPVTDCVIDNASAGELLTIAGASITGVTDKTAELVVEIAKRPDTLKCIASAGLSLLAVVV